MERPKYKASEEFVFSHSPFWIQIHNVPLEALCLENAISIGGNVGEVLVAEDPHYNGRYFRNFLRVRVMVDLRKALVPGFWLPKPDGVIVLWKDRWRIPILLRNDMVLGWPLLLVVAGRKLWLWSAVMGRKGNTLRKRSWKGVGAPFPGSGRKRPRLLMWMLKICSPSSLCLCSVIGENGPVYARESNDHDCPTPLKPDANSQPEGGYSNSAMLKANTPLAEGLTRAEVLYDKINLGTTKEMESVITLCSVVDSHGVEYGNIPGSQLDNQLAIIPYCGKEINAVINSLSCLGLKRSAADAGECAEPKRRRMIKVISDPGAGISSYANNLRKTKAKIKRSVKKRTRGEKENFPWKKKEVYR
ncbi:hypothetical protein K1719_029176 [Acacia pycnantha]|nr:hypothetical protein K1719_029176 [Acacia pycnantha]